MNQKLNRFNQIEHDTSRCDCDMCQFARNSAQKRVNPPSEPPTTGKEDAGFLVPEAENVSERQYGAGIGIPVKKTAFGHHLDSCGDCASVAEQFPDLELFDPQLCPEGRQLFRNPSQSVVTVPDFLSEWNSAPRWTTRTTERESAEY